MGAIRVIRKLRLLHDVDQTNLADGTVPTYRSASDKFEMEQGGGGGSAGSVAREITQTGHGLVSGDVVRLSGTTYVRAQANSIANAEVAGLVIEATSADAFTLLTHGHVDGYTGLTPGAVYFLDDDTPGVLTTTQPSDVGDVSKPLLISDTATSGYFHNWRGMVIVPPPSGGGGGDGIPMEIIDAAGDLIVGIADNVPARFAIGEEGEVLTVATGVIDWGNAWRQITQAEYDALDPPNPNHLYVIVG